MTNETKIKRTKQALVEAESKMEVALNRLQDSIKCFEMEFEENKELGNGVSANVLAWENVKTKKDRVDELYRLEVKLSNTLRELGV